MSWNKTFDLFIDIKKELGDNFTLHTPIKDLINQYCNDYYKEVCAPLELNQNENLLLIRYGRFSDVFSGESEYDYMEFWEVYDGLYKECRSLVIDIVNEEIVLSPFSKFRNLNECEETSLARISEKMLKAKNIEISNKLDGSMQCARWYDEKIVMSGSQAIDKTQSWRLQDGYNRLVNQANYVEMLKNNPEFTFIFEYITMDDAHVVKYEKEKEGLYLIGVRNSITGKQYSYETVINLANAYEVSTTELYDLTLEEMLDTLDKYTSDEKEGYVVNVDGFMFKVKCNDYLNIHGILSKLTSINLVIRHIAEDSFDDLISKVPELYKDRVMETANTVFRYLEDIDTTVKYYYDLAPKETTKEFMIWVDKQVPETLKHYVRNIYRGIENNFLKSGNVKSPKYKKIKEIQQQYEE